MEIRVCPGCGEDISYEANGITYSKATLVEIRGVYDGGLFLSHARPNGCGYAWHRWPEGSSLWQKAQPYVRQWNESSRYVESNEG